MGDGLIYEAVDMRFDVLVRKASGEETNLVSFHHHFDPPPDGPGRFDAVPYEADEDGIDGNAVPGDLLLLRFSVESQHPPGTRQYAPNGDGVNHNGRIPSLTLP